MVKTNGKMVKNVKNATKVKKGKNDKNYRPNILSNFPSQENMDGQ